MSDHFTSLIGCVAFGMAIPMLPMIVYLTLANVEMSKRVSAIEHIGAPALCGCGDYISLEGGKCVNCVFMGTTK